MSRVVNQKSRAYLSGVDKGKGSLLWRVEKKESIVDLWNIKSYPEPGEGQGDFFPLLCRSEGNADGQGDD